MGILYANHFQLREAPFSIAPNPRFLFMSEQHREALAHLLYGIEHDSGFVLLTGEVGTGKTTLCRCLLEKTPADVDVAFIINPRLSVVELLANICDELGIDYAQQSQSNRLLVDAINRYLLARHAEGRKTVLIIDEAQNLDSDVLEQLRLLTNLETDERKLLQIILLGQPELQQKLAHSDLRQLSQRITARYHLQALNRDESNAYIAHRLSVAGCDDALFSTAAKRHIHRISQGIPRLINLICDRAMLGAYAESVKKIDRKIIRKACREVLGEQSASDKRNDWKIPLLSLAFAAILLLVGVFTFTPEKAPLPAIQKATQATQIMPRKKETTHEKTEKPWAWPAATDTAQSRKNSFRALFKAWGMALPDATAACVFATDQGLACLQQIGDLGRLRSLNRPAVIAWQNSAGDVIYLAVLSLDGNSANAVIGDKQVRIPLPVLRQHWMQTFTLLWRTPEAYSSDLLPGTAGPSAKWLNEKLAALDPALSAQRIPGIYQGNWVRRLRQFQRDTGLPPDGAAGPQTLIRLNTALQTPGPRLMRRRVRGGLRPTGRCWHLARKCWRSSPRT
ncbi:MAG: AAA family ATPase, partial [Mariprofundaceae bacterium]|nr:AAA family ATPase [Mariprofundaceae bacterium]